MQPVVLLLDLAGVAVFAISGALAAGRKRMDLFGVVVLACVTALGGGTARDLTLGAYPVFWVADPRYVFVAVAGAIVTFVAVRRWRLPQGLLLLADAFGLALFTVIGAERALAHGASGPVAVIMAVVTGVVGGMLRDVLVREIPFICRSELYATASLCGAVVFVAFAQGPPPLGLAVAASFVVTLGLRLAAIRWGLSLPSWPQRRCEREALDPRHLRPADCRKETVRDE